MRLWSNIAALQTAAIASTLILTIGAVIEYWANLKLLALLSLKWLLRKSTPFERCAFRKLFLHAIGPILVVIGIAGEVVFEGRDFVLEDEQEGRSQQTIQSLKATVSGNEREAAQLRKNAEQLKKDAESEHLARVKIEAAVAFRSLNDKQKRDIGTALSPFGSITGASMWFVNGSADAELFADDIAEALRTAHIHTTTIGGIIEAPEGGGHWDEPIKSVETGVDITSTSNPVARQLADALFKELTSRGFDSKRRPDEKSKDNPPGPVIWVTVRSRPSGPQGEYKLEALAEAKAKKATSTSNNR